MKILITGGAGFIGSALIRHLIRTTRHHVVNVDNLSYAGDLESLSSVSENARYQFERADIADADRMYQLLVLHQPDAIMHLAAETHVDRSITGPAAFVHSNIVGTYVLLEATRHYWHDLPAQRKADFRFHHVSTDEVYGDLSRSGAPFVETSAYAPSSPYSASKASADHLARAWHRTYGLPIVISTSSNNYGPFQFPEKLIPVAVLNALSERPIPVYGKGDQTRDWLHVEDHARGLYSVLTRGGVGQTYNIGGHAETRNIEVVRQIAAILDAKKPRAAGSYADLIHHVTDRPGHDVRYAIDSQKIRTELGWAPQKTFDSGLNDTVDWYVNHQEWCVRMLATA